MMKKKLLSISFSLALLSVYGISIRTSEAVDVNENTSTKTISVIDGYLENTDVYVDRNNNGMADVDEKLHETTDLDGKITITIADAQFDLIAQINGNATKDSDGKGTTGRSYQMIAKAGLGFITPFTTIAKIQSKTLAEVANDLNIDESVISGDYIAQKEVTETRVDAKKAHVFARNLTTTLSANLSENDEDNLSRFINTIKGDIEQAINADVDLDTIVSEVVTLEDILVAEKTFFSVAVNFDTNSAENVSMIEYLTSARYKFSNKKNILYGLYTVGANQVTYDSEIYPDTIVFVSKNNYISISESGILDVVSTTIAAQNITQSMFTGTTWYQIFDDGDGNTQPCILEVIFTNTTEMKYVEDSCEFSDSDDSSNIENPYHWVVFNNELSIFDDEVGIKGKEGDFIITSNSERVMAVKNMNTGKRSLFLKDKELATSIFTAWDYAIIK